MNKDRVEGKVKDIAGRVERQAGEWTDDTNAQVKGAAKQVEGKVQNAWGQAKDATKRRRPMPRSRSVRSLFPTMLSPANQLKKSVATEVSKPAGWLDGSWLSHPASLCF